MNSVVPEENPDHWPFQSAKDRPVRAPLGPRILTRPKAFVEIANPGPSTSSSNPDPCSPSSSSPAFCATPLSRSASPVLESPFNTSSSPATPHRRLSMSSLAQVPHRPTAAEVAVQVPSPRSTPYSNPTPLSSQSKPVQPSASKSSAGAFLPPRPLPPPPAISFDSIPIPWKGLPLEAAQWTFSSSELQEIVSRAVRVSAKESFIRLLSLQALDDDIVQEDIRLSEDRIAAQAKWRFEVNRRTMLINATTATLACISDGDQDHGLSKLNDVIYQLAGAINSCDSQMSAIFYMMDQQMQMSSLQHRHWTSALSIALRKLNKTCERQADQLKTASSTIQTLEDELEEAWKEAEAVAKELDDLRAKDIASEEDVQTDSEFEDQVHQQECDDYTQVLEDMTGTTDIGEVVGVTATAVASRATLLSPVSPGFLEAISDTRSVKSAKSAKSAKSTRSKRSARDTQSRLSRVSAARVRSRTASNASLRLPRNLRTMSSTPNTPAQPPPIPTLPDNHSLLGRSFLDMDNASNEFVTPLRKWLPRRQPEPKAALPDVPSSNKSSLDGVLLPHRLSMLGGSPSPSQSSLLPPARSSHPQWRKKHTMSLSNSDPCPCDPMLKSELQALRPGSASPRLVHSPSLVKKASSVFRRLSRRTMSAKHRSSTLLTTSKVKEEDEESMGPRVGSSLR